METFIELYPYVSQHQNQFIIRNPAKETVFFGDKEFFTHSYQCLDIPPFLVQADQFLFLDLIVRFILECAVDVALQVNDITQGSQGNVTQYTLNGTQVSGLPFLMVFLLIIRDGIFEIADMLVDKRSIDLLVYLEHLLEKVQVDILHFEKRTILTKHSVVDQALYTLQFVFSQFQCILPPEGLLFPFAEHLFQQKLFAAHHFQQLVNRVKCSHV